MSVIAMKWCWRGLAWFAALERSCRGAVAEGMPLLFRLGPDPELQHPPGSPKGELGREPEIVGAGQALVDWEWWCMAV